MESKQFLRGYDIDGTLTTGLTPIKPFVIISGRTFAEYNETTKKLAQDAPVYIRGSGRYGDQQHAGEFKAHMINLLGVEEFYEDDQVQIDIIRKSCTKCRIKKVKGDGSLEDVAHSNNNFTYSNMNK